jgi:hypothetical protein
MPDFPLIDSHQHAFRHGRDDAGLIADMDEHGIERAWVMTSERPVSIAHSLAPYEPRWKGCSADADDYPHQYRRDPLVPGGGRLLLARLQKRTVLELSKRGSELFL